MKRESEKDVRVLTSLYIYEAPVFLLPLDPDGQLRLLRIRVCGWLGRTGPVDA